MTENSQSTVTQKVSCADHKQYVKTLMTKLNVESSVTKLTLLGWYRIQANHCGVKRSLMSQKDIFHYLPFLYLPTVQNTLI